MEVSDRLRERRHELGKTQEQVAREAEMYVTQYNGYERGRSAPSPATLKRLAKALETTLEALIPPSPQPSEMNATRSIAIRRLKDQFRARIAAELDLAQDNIAIRIEVL